VVDVRLCHKNRDRNERNGAQFLIEHNPNTLGLEGESNTFDERPVSGSENGLDGPRLPLATTVLWAGAPVGRRADTRRWLAAAPPESAEPE